MWLANMKVVKPRTIEDIAACVEIYNSINDHSFLHMDVETSFSNFLKLSKQGFFMRLLVDDTGVVRAWIFASKVKPVHSDRFSFQQDYFASNLSGVKAYKAVVLLHEAMIEEATRLNIGTAISQGSHMDETFTFTRILEKQGWQRRGHIAVKRLSS
jgi:hypothetical protein